MLAERDETMADLAPLLVGVPEVFREALRRTRAAPPLDLVERTKTSTANLMRDYAVGGLTKLWAPLGATLCEPNQQTLFVFKGYALRVKKLNRQSFSSNVKTHADRNYRRQGQIEGLPKLANLEIGYVLNQERTEVADIRVVCLNGYRWYWWQSVETPNTNVYDLLAPQPGPTPQAPKPLPKAPAEAEVGVSIKPKR